MSCRRALVAILAVSFGSSAFADNWPSWRGPTQNGISNETSVPVKWDEKENVAWRIDLPGPAGATPVVWGERIFLTSVDDSGNLWLMCFTTKGKEAWRKKMGSGNKNARGDEGNSASPSPITDGKHVWAMMGTGQVLCCTVEGEEKWKFNLQDRYGKFEIQFGMSSTPVLHDGMLYFQLIHGIWRSKGELAIVAAVNAATGEEVWKVDRHTGAKAENKHSYASPVLYNFGGTKFLLTHGGDYTIAHSLKDGSTIWKLGGMNPHDDPNQRYHNTLRFVASPGVADGIVICPTAKKYPVFAVRPDMKGDLTGNKDALHWTMPRNTPDVPSPLIHDGLVYLCRENGNLICLDQKTGEELYEQRTNPQRHRASPVYANGNIYLAARDGQVTVVKAGREFEIVSKNKIQEQLAASPVIANGTIYLRSFKGLWAIRNGAKVSSR